MAIITLTSDWGWKDHYVAAIKGAILTKAPNSTIIDISHSISAFDTEEAAFVLRNCYRNFPNGTIHIIGINSENSEKTPHLVVFCDNQYFIGADNGIFSMILEREPDQIISLKTFYDSDKIKYTTFPSRDRFAKVAAHIALGNPIDTLGIKHSSIVKKQFIQPIITECSIRGEVIYIDNYENLITNISLKLFEKIRRDRQPIISYLKNEIKKISNSYSENIPGEIMAIFSSHGYLEIAIKNGNARGLLGGNINTKVIIDFF
ncbi:MAG: S-adenosyl-l-methionine hydroxide adenosyltransferase family protein [Bacteroidales bacterium]